MTAAAEGLGQTSGSFLHVVFPPCQVFEALTVHALCQIVATSYRVSFSLRYEWSRSFHLTTLDKLVETSLQVVPPDYHRGTLHF